MFGLNEILPHSLAYAMGEDEGRAKAREEDNNHWHTGEPTEEGWYLIAYREFPDTPIKYAVEPFGNGKWLEYTIDRLAWQKIEPYNED